MTRIFKRIAVAAALLAAFSVSDVSKSWAASKATPPPPQDWSFSGVFGTFDRAQLQRGYLVYREVCAACHSMKQVYFRHLVDIGLSENAIKAIAAEFEVAGEPDEDGEPTDRPAQLFDRLPSPYANDNEARSANNGALPPDLSLIAKSRVGGSDYIHALLTGYLEKAPAGVTMGEGMNYNTYFAANQIAMAPPLVEDGVEYEDGTKASIDQQARDVAAFMTWAAEPEMEERKRMGIKVLLFLIILTAMLYAVKRRVWSDLH